MDLGQAAGQQSLGIIAAPDISTASHQLSQDFEAGLAVFSPLGQSVHQLLTLPSRPASKPVPFARS
jgi:hypothetical protein